MLRMLLSPFAKTPMQHIQRLKSVNIYLLTFSFLAGVQVIHVHFI
jgi:hypothetical protein